MAINLWDPPIRSGFFEFEADVNSPASPPLGLISPLATNQPTTPVLELERNGSDPDSQLDSRNFLEPWLEAFRENDLSNQHNEGRPGRFSILRGNRSGMPRWGENNTTRWENNRRRGQNSDIWEENNARSSENDVLDNEIRRQPRNEVQDYLTRPRRSENLERRAENTERNFSNFRLPSNNERRSNNQNQNIYGRFGNNASQQTFSTRRIPFVQNSQSNNRNSTSQWGLEDTNLSRPRFSGNNMVSNNRYVSRPNRNSDINNVNLMDLSAENDRNNANDEVKNYFELTIRLFARFNLVFYKRIIRAKR